MNRLTDCEWWPFGLPRGGGLRRDRLGGAGWGVYAGTGNASTGEQGYVFRLGQVSRVFYSLHIDVRCSA